MSTPAELVAESFAQAQSYASNAQALLQQFTTTLNSAIQTAPLVDLTFAAIPDPGSDTAPANSATYTAPSTYTDGVITALATALGTINTTALARLSGGTGLDASVEAAIWDRARDREAALAQAAIDDVTVQSEALGFELPPGVLNDGIRRETRAYYDKVSALSRDIAVKQAELEQSNMKDAIQQATQYITAGNQYEDVLSQIEQRRAQVAVEVYRGELEAFRANVEAFRAQIEQDVKHWEVSIKQYEAQINFVQENQKINSEITRANLATVLEAGKVGAQVYAQLVAAAYSLIHASASVSASASNSVGYSYSNDTDTAPASVTAV